MGRPGRRHRGEQPGQLAGNLHQGLCPLVRQRELGGGEVGERVLRTVRDAGEALADAEADAEADPDAEADADAGSGAEGDEEADAPPLPAPNAFACRTASARSGASRSSRPGWAAITAVYRPASVMLSRAARARARSAAEGLPPVVSLDGSGVEQPASAKVPAAAASRVLRRGPDGVRDGRGTTRQTSSEGSYECMGELPVITVPAHRPITAQRLSPICLRRDFTDALREESGQAHPSRWTATPSATGYPLT